MIQARTNERPEARRRCVLEHSNVTLRPGGCDLDETGALHFGGPGGLHRGAPGPLSRLRLVFRCCCGAVIVRRRPPVRDHPIANAPVLAPTIETCSSLPCQDGFSSFPSASDGANYLRCSHFRSADGRTRRMSSAIAGLDSHSTSNEMPSRGRARGPDVSIRSTIRPMFLVTVQSNELSMDARPATSARTTTTTSWDVETPLSPSSRAERPKGYGFTWPADEYKDTMPSRVSWQSSFSSINQQLLHSFPLFSKLSLTLLDIAIDS